MKPYDHSKIEKKWQKVWDDEKTYRTLDVKEAEAKGRKPYYVLDMFPYPSGSGLHVGHPRGYIASDVFARMKRVQGFNVLHPMGFDSFGLPAEQYAIQTGNNPGPFTDELIVRYREQLAILGFSFDWSREVATHRPEFYKWTQWIFLQIYNSYYDAEQDKARPISELVKKLEKTDPSWNGLSEIERQKVLMNYRLAYEGYAEVNWCPELGTVLANDEVVDGPNGPVSERGEFPVEKKKMRQWFMRITAYGDRLLKGLDTIDWPENIKEIQRNWIGKSEGSEITFHIQNKEFGYDITNIDVFTTRADTLYGVTYIALAVDHPAVEHLLKKEISNWDQVYEYIQDVKKEDPYADKEITGIKLEGVVAKQSFMDDFEVPVYLTNYVLGSYGTGAVMGVPAHDERDFAFAKKYDLPIIPVTLDLGGSVQMCWSYEKWNEEWNSWYSNEGRVIFEGKKISSEEARKKITEHVGGKLVTRYKIRDAIFARQRYWGEPIPLIHHEDGTISEVSGGELPLELPKVASYQPSGTGESPLATVKSWVKAGYETNTMPGWAGSSWYFLRYMDPHNADAFAGKDEVDYWNNVNMYVGGAEHATGHLLYSRFWHKVLKDLGYVPTEEPFAALRNQGMIGGTDGRKMSKRWGNVINPDDVVRDLGADTMRVYESFMGPFESHLPWSTDSIVGARRFIERVWRLAETVGDATPDSLRKSLHKTTKKVTGDIHSFSFNTAVSAMMIFVNDAEKAAAISSNDYRTFLQILAPFAPHVAEELWESLGGEGSIHHAPWPVYDETLIVDDTVTIGIQVNGKVRAELTIPVDADEASVRAQVLEISEITKWIDGKEIKKFIYVPSKIISIVI